jgi:cell division protein FtsW
VADPAPASADPNAASGFWSRPHGPLEPAARALVVVALALMAFGVIVVYSASWATGIVHFEGDPTHFLRRQAIWAGIGVLAMFAAMRVDPRRLESLAKPALVVTLVLLAALLVPGVAPEIKGARRWFRIGAFSVQPSELAKLSLILWLATHLAREGRRLDDWRRGTLPAIVPLGLACFLVLIEPDFGTALFLGAVGVAMTLVGGVPVQRLAMLAAYAAPVVAWQVAKRLDVMMRRLQALSVEEAAAGGEMASAAQYQVHQSLVALGSGGLFGRGLGAGHQKLFFLPEARTDFILPVIGEELGLVGTATVLVLYAALILCGLRVALGAARRDRFGFLLTFGLVFWIGLQAAGNVAVVTASVPTKGIALPFVSLGGSSLVVLCIAVGLVYAVARHVDAQASALARRRRGAVRVPGGTLPVGGAA